MVYFSPVFWGSYAQRPHFMIRSFFVKGGKHVLWLNPYPNRLPRVRDVFRGAKLYDQGTPADERVRAINISSLPVEPLPGGVLLNRMVFWPKVIKEVVRFARDGHCIVGIGRPSGLALNVTKLLADNWKFYDAMDDFPEFYSGLSRVVMRRRERQITALVDEVFV